MFEIFACCHSAEKCVLTDKLISNAKTNNYYLYLITQCISYVFVIYIVTIFQDLNNIRKELGIFFPQFKTVEWLCLEDIGQT